MGSSETMITWARETAISSTSPSKPMANSLTMGSLKSQNTPMITREMRMTMVMTVSVNRRSRRGFCCRMRA